MLYEENTIAKALGLEITSVKDGLVKGKMPVDSRTHQPYGLLHGGASVVLAETLGSVGSHFLVEKSGKGAVGIEVNANHVRTVELDLFMEQLKLCTRVENYTSGLLISKMIKTD